MNQYEIINEKESLLIITGNKNNGTILIDTEDIERLKNHSWHIKDGKGYVSAKIKGKTTKVHRFLLNIDDKNIIVDHHDRNVWNNRKYNLRPTDSSTNNLNCSFSKNNTSGRTGVTHRKGQGNRSDFFEAKFTKDGKVSTKRFSINKYGHDEAFRLAVEFREGFEKENNVLSAKTFNDYRNTN